MLTYNYWCKNFKQSINKLIPANQVALVLENLHAHIGGIREMGLIPGSGRFPGGGNGKPLRYSCWKNPMERGAWQASPWGHKESDTTEYAHTNI